MLFHQLVVRPRSAGQGAGADGQSPGADVFTPQELELLHQPLDYLGFNVYNACAAQQPGSEYTVNTWQGSPRTAMEWPITPDCIYWAIRF